MHSWTYPFNLDGETFTLVWLETQNRIRSGYFSIYCNKNTRSLRLVHCRKTKTSALYELKNGAIQYFCNVSAPPYKNSTTIRLERKGGICSRAKQSQQLSGCASFLMRVLDQQPRFKLFPLARVMPSAPSAQVHTSCQFLSLYKKKR